jgi:iron-sulfur cluster assembly protein
MQTATGAAIVSLTPAAANQARLRLDRAGKPGALLRLSVKGGGCSGLSYVLSIEESARASDLLYETGGVRIAIDPKSARFLQGATLDYSLKHLLEGGWVWTNPNADRSCGCGTSFSPRL